MAYVAGYWKVTASFRDRDKNVRHVSILLDSALGFAELVDDGKVSSLIAAMAALSDAALERYTLSLAYADATLVASTPPEASDVERKGVFEWRAANGQRSKTEIPSVLSTLVSDGSNIIPVTGVVATFVTAMTTNSIFSSNPVTNTGSNFTALVPPAHKIHRASSEG